MTDTNVLDLLTRIATATESMLAELQKLNAHPYAAQSQPATATITNGNGGYGYRDFACTKIVMTYDDTGQPAYKAQGIPFSKFGVRIWPEVLPLVGIDPAALKPGPNQFSANLRAEMGERGPRKVIGLATLQPPTLAPDDGNGEK